MRRFFKVVSYSILGLVGAAFAFWLYAEHPDRFGVLVGVGFGLWAIYAVINDWIIRPIAARLSDISRQIDDCQNRLDRIERRQASRNF